MSYPPAHYVPVEICERLPPPPSSKDKRSLRLAIMALHAPYIMKIEKTLMAYRSTSSYLSYSEPVRFFGLDSIATSSYSASSSDHSLMAVQFFVRSAVTVPRDGGRDIMLGDGLADILAPYFEKHGTRLATRSSREWIHNTRGRISCSADFWCGRIIACIALGIWPPVLRYLYLRGDSSRLGPGYQDELVMIGTEHIILSHSAPAGRKQIGECPDRKPLVPRPKKPIPRATGWEVDEAS